METYFAFEQDFVEQQIRCIPMVVRFKLDAVGVKLKLAEWSRFSPAERRVLALSECGTPYRLYLCGLIRKYTGREPTSIPVELDPAWQGPVPDELREKAAEFGWSISAEEWRALSDLRRFALLKLCRPGHENRNFPRAMEEFRLSGRRVS